MSVRKHLDSGSESDDEDFAPTTVKRNRNDSDDDDSDDDGQEFVAQGDKIDEDEVAAMKREREQMVEEAGGEHRLGKRHRATPNSSTATADSTTDTQAAAQKAEEDWSAIKDVPASSTAADSEGPDLISVPQTYEFAGETHTSTKMLPRTHPDAVAHITSLNTAAAPPPPKPRPGPRKKKSSLAALSAAATSTKPNKLNTLEKSKLDWESFKQAPSTGLTQQELDEIEQQTTGGASGLGNMKGYLERQDFLDRVRNRTG